MRADDCVSGAFAERSYFPRINRSIVPIAANHSLRYRRNIVIFKCHRITLSRYRDEVNVARFGNADSAVRRGQILRIENATHAPRKHVNNWPGN